MVPTVTTYPSGSEAGRCSRKTLEAETHEASIGPHAGKTDYTRDCCTAKSTVSIQQVKLS